MDATVIDTACPFRSAHAALVFAFNFCSEQYPMTPMAKLIKGEPTGTGKGLVGVDGAAQAGMILREVSGLGEGSLALLTARFVAREGVVLCQCGSLCCSGRKANPEWLSACAILAEQCIAACPAVMSNRRLRLGIVQRFFGGRINLGELGAECKINKNLVTGHNSAISGWLKREEARAYRMACERLKESGISE